MLNRERFHDCGMSGIRDPWHAWLSRPCDGRPSPARHERIHIVHGGLVPGWSPVAIAPLGPPGFPGAPGKA
jgi:hypothetical protein